MWCGMLKSSFFDECGLCSIDDEFVVFHARRQHTTNQLCTYSLPGMSFVIESVVVILNGVPHLSGEQINRNRDNGSAANQTDAI